MNDIYYENRNAYYKGQLTARKKEKLMDVVQYNNEEWSAYSLGWDDVKGTRNTERLNTLMKALWERKDVSN